MNQPELPGASEYTERLEAAKPSPFVQPKSGPRKGKPMTPKGQEVAARLKELFFQYGQRRSTDNRTAQAHIGPSQIGTPCDRRLAMSLMQLPAVNVGGDGWAAFIGTCVHAGLADMFVWASANSGRYAVEVPLAFPSSVVPRGTGDLLDRTLLMFLDHKVMGRWSLTKLKQDGPNQTYRVQVHTYAFGARLKGEQIDHVAIVGWPRESSLDDLYVWTEPYSPQVARDAFARVDRINEETLAGRPLHQFDIADDCMWCPYHMKDAKNLEGGACNGRY